MRNALPLAAVIASVLAACDVGEFGEPGGPDGTGADARAASASDAPLATSRVAVTATTTTAAGEYAPRNVVAVWVESNGTIVRTIQRWSGVRTQHLVAWNQMAGVGDTDAVSGATRLNHAVPLSITWDLRDRAGVIVPDGTYTIRMESTELNANDAAQNNQGTFTFVKGPAPQQQTGLTNGGFTNVSIDFVP